MRRWLVPALLSVSLSGCIYANVNSPFAYRSPTPADVGGMGQLGPEVRGEACMSIILGLVATGDAGYQAAIANAKQSSGANMLADVKTDTNYFNILGVYQKYCTLVSARAVK